PSIGRRGTIPLRSLAASRLRRIDHMKRRTFVRVVLTCLAVAAVSFGVCARPQEHVSWARAGGHFVSISTHSGAIVIAIANSDRDAPLRWQSARGWECPLPFAGVMGGPKHRSRDFYVLNWSGGEGEIHWCPGTDSATP